MRTYVVAATAITLEYVEENAAGNDGLLLLAFPAAATMNTLQLAMLWWEVVCKA